MADRQPILGIKGTEKHARIMARIGTRSRAGLARTDLLRPNPPMRTPRIYIDHELATGMELTLATEQHHYLARVMRVRPGTRIVLFNGRGGEFEAVVCALHRHETHCRIDAHLAVDRELPCRVYIVQAACRNDKVETVLQKGTELGAAGFEIARCRRSDLKLSGEKLALRLERWRKIILEAAEQSGRTSLPTLTWRETLPAGPLQGACYLLHPHADRSWADARPEIAAAREIRLAVGPEGGFSEDEVERMAAAGFTPLAFGPRILRTETAAPALLAAIQAVQDPPSVFSNP